MNVTGRISDERIREILAAADAAGTDSPGQVIMSQSEYDGAATAARYGELEDLYVLTDGTVIDGEGPGWRARWPASR